MYMIELPLRAERLVAHAQSHGHNHISDEDLGYATHGWLKAALGDLAPAPFRLRETRNNDLRLLGYAGAAIEVLREHAIRFADPLAASVCDWSSAASKSMADISWQRGQRLSFEVRTCPVVRGEGGERDAYLASLPPAGNRATAGRAEVYGQWLAARMGDAVNLDLETLHLCSFRLVSAWRQTRKGHCDGKRGARLLRPDALLTGRLTINDPQSFRELLRRGVGRHRAFGFGMLLVRPH